MPVDGSVLSDVESDSRPESQPEVAAEQLLNHARADEKSSCRRALKARAEKWLFRCLTNACFASR